MKKQTQTHYAILCHTAPGLGGGRSVGGGGCGPRKVCEYPGRQERGGGVVVVEVEVRMRRGSRSV